MKISLFFDAVLIGNKRLFDAVKEKEELYMSPEFTDEVNNRLAELEIICCEEDPTYEYDIKLLKSFEDLGFPSSTHQNLMSTLTVEIKLGSFSTSSFPKTRYFIF